MLNARHVSAAIEDGNVEPLRELLHPDMVAFTACDRPRLDGPRDAHCLVVGVHPEDAGRPEARGRPEGAAPRRGVLAVVAYDYRLIAELEGKQYDLAGRDMFVLAEEAGRWRSVANHFSPFPREAQR